jgi:23S rRNA pseudouridine1911/1915/1917 synthase
LDKDTSGLILLCKNDEAHAALAADFEARRIKKGYQALVCAVPPARGRIEAPLARSHNNRTKMTVAPEGRISVTEYTVVKSWPRYAWLDVDLLTGRTHQIRVHLAYIHHPVVGDVVYGGYHRALNCAPTTAVAEAITALHGQALHAARLELTHPRSGALMKFEAALPRRIAGVIEALDLADPAPISK